MWPGYERFSGNSSVVAGLVRRTCCGSIMPEAENSEAVKRVVCDFLPILHHGGAIAIGASDMHRQGAQYRLLSLEECASMY